MTGIEPVTSSLPRKRSTPELHRRKVLNLFYRKRFLPSQEILSERPGSNRRHSAWKADALPTELLSHIIQKNYIFCVDNYKSILSGESRIRTYEVERQRSYSPPQLAALVSPQQYFIQRTCLLLTVNLRIISSR